VRARGCCRFDSRDGILDHQADAWLQAEPAGGFEKDVRSRLHSLYAGCWAGFASSGSRLPSALIGWSSHSGPSCGWQEKITNIVTLAGFSKARDELLDLCLTVSTEAIEKILGKEQTGREEEKRIEELLQGDKQ